MTPDWFVWLMGISLVGSMANLVCMWWLLRSQGMCVSFWNNWATFASFVRLTRQETMPALKRKYRAVLSLQGILLIALLIEWVIWVRIETQSGPR